MSPGSHGSDPLNTYDKRMYRGYDAIKPLRRETGKNIPELLVLAQCNDPFYAGSPADQMKAQWFAELWQQFEFTPGVHL
jgi:hypothetical protein